LYRLVKNTVFLITSRGQKRRIVEGNNGVAKKMIMVQIYMCVYRYFGSLHGRVSFFFFLILTYVSLVMLICFSLFFSQFFFSYIFFFLVSSFLSLLLAATIMMVIDGTNKTKTKGATTIIRLVPIY